MVGLVLLRRQKPILVDADEFSLLLLVAKRLVLEGAAAFVDGRTSAFRNEMPAVEELQLVTKSASIAALAIAPDEERAWILQLVVVANLVVVRIRTINALRAATPHEIATGNERRCRVLGLLVGIKLAREKLVPLPSLAFNSDEAKTKYLFET